MQLFNDDCLKVLPTILDKSIDLILTDPPYGTTQCKWDSIIPFEPMWKELKRIIKDNGCIALFAQDKFTANLIFSNKHSFCGLYKTRAVKDTYVCNKWRKRHFKR